LAKRDRRPEQLETMAADVHGALDRAERLVDSLLTLTRSQHLAHASEPVDLATASQDALDSLADAIAERGLTVHAELHPTATAGDRALLERLVGNLLDNAVRHNHDGGWLSVRTDADGDQAAIVVGNSGPSVDPAGVPRLFEPFHRADGPARTNGSGLGLGLSIVRAVADAHRADVAVTARPDGGLLVAVRLPRVSARTDT
jgi:signal transduction histidine kinase